MAKKLNVQSPGQANMVEYGQLGLRVLTNAAASASDEIFAELHATQDTVFACDLVSELGDSSISGLTLLGTDKIKGLFKNVVITSGKLIGKLIEKE